MNWGGTKLVITRRRVAFDRMMRSRWLGDYPALLVIWNLRFKSWIFILWNDTLASNWIEPNKSHPLRWQWNPLRTFANKRKLRKNAENPLKSIKMLGKRKSIENLLLQTFRFFLIVEDRCLDLLKSVEIRWDPIKSPETRFDRPSHQNHVSNSQKVALNYPDCSLLLLDISGLCPKMHTN